MPVELSTIIDNATLAIVSGKLTPKDTIARTADLDAVGNALTTHTGDDDNPHATTAAQVGALATGTRGAADGVASLDEDALVPLAQIPGTAAGKALLQAIDVPAQRAIIARLEKTLLAPMGYPAAGAQSISGRIYMNYFGYFPPGAVITYVNRVLEGTGSGTQVDEVALYSTPLAPDHDAQDMTRLAYTTNTGTLTSGGGPRRHANSNSLAHTLAAWTHLWGVVRTAMGTTQPQFKSCSQSASYVLGHTVRSSSDSLGTLASLATITAAQISQVTPGFHPYITLSTQ